MGKAIFENDPLAGIVEAFEEIFPDKEFSLQVVQSLEDENGEKQASFSAFPREGGAVIVALSAQMTYENMVEALAHELAHVATGAPEPGAEGHTPQWQVNYKAIISQYMSKRQTAEAMEDEGKRAVQGVQTADG